MSISLMVIGTAAAVVAVMVEADLVAFTIVCFIAVGCRIL